MITVAEASTLGEAGCNRVFTMTRINIEWQNQFGRWQHIQTKHNEADAFRTAQNRAPDAKRKEQLNYSLKKKTLICGIKSLTAVSAMDCLVD